MYCIKCGVELADSERVCPLCGTRVFHPDLPCGQGEPPYPPADHPRHEEVSRIGVLFVISVCMLLPAVITVLCDWRINGTIVWSGFAVGGLLLLYILAVLPLWFKRPNPVIFVPIDFAAIGVFLLYVNYATGGHWFLTFALPVTGAAGLLVCAMVTLLRYLPGGHLYVFSGALMLSGGVDVKTVQEVLGHENLNTTQIYTHIESTELKIAAEANPLSKLDFSDKMEDNNDSNQ